MKRSIDRVIAERLLPVSLLLSCMALVACATEVPRQQVAPYQPALYVPPTYAPAPVARPARASSVTPLDYYQWAQAAAPEELMAERLRLASPRRSAIPVVDAVHLGILLSLSAFASPETDREAMALLDTVAEVPDADTSSRDYAIFADLLLSHLQQREALRDATSSVVETREELETAERTNDQLQEKIEALTSIEQQLIEREQEQEQQEPQ